MDKLKDLSIYETVLIVVKDTKTMSTHELQVLEWGQALDKLPCDTLLQLGELGIKMIGDGVRYSKDELNQMYGLGLE